MKKIILLLTVVVLLIPACTKDKGTYDYVDLNEITIEGVDDLYVALREAPFTIKPEIKQKLNDSESALEYLWYSYNKLTQLYEADTLAYTKDLELASLMLDPNDYELVFRVTDTSSGIYYDHRSAFIVKGFPDGLQVLSNKGGDAQVSILRGTAEGISDFEAYKAKNNDEIAGTNPVSIMGINEWFRVGKPNRIAILCDDASLGVYTSGNDFLKTINIVDAFNSIDAPSSVSKNLAAIVRGEYVVGIFGDNNLYTSFQPGGPFGAECDFKYALTSVSPNFAFYNNGVTLYNPDIKGFCKTDTWGTSTMPFPPSVDDGDAFDVSNTGLDALYGKKVAEYGMGVFIDEVTSQKYILAISDASPVFKKEIVGENAEYATLFEFLNSKQVMLYAHNNIIYSYDIVANKVLYTYAVADGMTIDCMEISTDDKKLYIGMGDGSNDANSGSVHVLNIDLDGEIVSVNEAYDNKFGRVVDFYENY